jgi:hypothetical protein
MTIALSGAEEVAIPAVEQLLEVLTTLEVPALGSDGPVGRFAMACYIQFI